jgi:hypothetical protein
MEQLLTFLPVVEHLEGENCMYDERLAVYRTVDSIILLRITTLNVFFLSDVYSRQPCVMV